MSDPRSEDSGSRHTDWRVEDSDGGAQGGEPRPEAGEKSLERQIRAFHWVRLLAELPGRIAGSDAERVAASRVESWLRDVGFDEVAFEAVASRLRTPSVLALHLGLGAAACALGGPLAPALAVLTLVSLRRELTSESAGLTRFVPVPDSVSVVARAGALRPRRRVVLVAHLDSPQTGRLLGSRARVAGVARGVGAAGFLSLPVAALGAVVLATGAMLLGAEGILIRGFIGGLALALALATVACVEWARAPGSPGANANAAGVAALLACGEQLLAQLPLDTELWCCGTGGGESGSAGVRAVLERHPEWRSDGTLFVCFESVGGGALHYVASETGLDRVVHPPMLTELARRVAASGAFGCVEPVDLRMRTEAEVLARSGVPVLCLVSAEADGLPRHYGRAADLPEDLEMETVIRAADFAASVVSAAWRGDAAPLAYV